MVLKTVSKRDVVVSLLKKHEEGLTIVEIAKAVSLSRNTVPVILAELKGEGVLWVRPVGKAKLHYWRGE